MEHPHFIIAFTGNPHAGKNTIFRNLTQGKWLCKDTAKSDSPFPNRSFLYASYKYKAIEFPGILSLSSPVKEAGYTAEYICSGKANVIAVVGHALQLDRLLHLLKEIISLEPVKDRQIPIVLCLSCCDEAEQNGVFIDISLLHDVLQIPIVPLHGFGREQMDDLKAAFHYSVQPHHKREFLYNCLDFSPAKLAKECVIIKQPSLHHSNESRCAVASKNSLTSLAVLLTFVFWISSSWTGWFMERLWPVLFQAETNLAAFVSWLGMPVWFTGCIVHGAFQSACWVILMALPPFSLFLPLLGLLEDAGYIPLDGATLGITNVLDDDMRSVPGYYGYISILTIHILILAITAITPSLMPPHWPCRLPLPQPLTIIRMFCCLLSGAATALTFYLPLYHTGSLRQFLYDSRNIPVSHRPVRVFESIFRSTGCWTLPLLNKAVLAAVPVGILIWLLGNIAYTGPSLSLQNTQTLYDMLVSHGWTVLCTFLFTLLHWSSISACLYIYRRANPRRKVIAVILTSTAFGIMLCAAAVSGMAALEI